jgi:hypothetical protein
MEGFTGFALVSPFSSCVECVPPSTPSTTLFCAACSGRYTGTCPSPTGVIATTLDVRAISRLLAAAFLSSESLVFLVDVASDVLMGINDPSIPVLTRPLQTGPYQYVNIAKCSSPLVAHMGSVLNRLGWPAGLRQIEHTNGSSFYVQTAPFDSMDAFQIPGLTMRVVVVARAPGVDDAVHAGSPNAYAVLGLAVSGSVFCAACLVGVVLQRDKQVIKAAGVPWLVMFLAGVLGMNAASFLLIGHNTISSCFAYPWLSDVSFVASMTAIIVKTWRLHRIFNMTFEPVSDTQLAVVVGTPLLCVVLLLAIASSGEGFQPFEETRLGLDGALGVYHFCRTPPIMIAIQVLIAAMLGFGCFLSFRTRLVDPSFGESKAVLFLIFTTTLCCAFNVAIPSLVPSYSSQVLTVVLAVWIGSVASVCALLVPRFYGLIEFGDSAATLIARAETDVVYKFSCQSFSKGTLLHQRGATRNTTQEVRLMQPMLADKSPSTIVDCPERAVFQNLSELEQPPIVPNGADAATDFLNVTSTLSPRSSLSEQAYSDLLQGSYQPPPFHLQMEMQRKHAQSWET